MRNAFIAAALIAAFVLVFSSVAGAQAPQTAKSPWQYYPRDTAVGDGGPAPKRDLSGTWAGPGSSPSIPAGTPAERPSLTPQAQQILKDRKPMGRYGPAAMNDPAAEYCEPLRFSPEFVYQD